MDQPVFHVIVRYPDGPGALRAEEQWMLSDEFVTWADRVLDPVVLRRCFPWWVPESITIRVFPPAEWDGEPF